MLIMNGIRWIARIGVLLLGAVALGGGLVLARYRQEIAAHQARVMGGTLIETPCGQIEYAEAGSGTPILALHGAGGGYDQGLLMAGRIGAGYRVIAPSRFGFLRAPIPTDASVDAQADMYVCLLDHLRLERVHLVAFSAGGPSALAFALRHPERVEKLVLISALSTLRPVRDAGVGPSAEMLSEFGYWALSTYMPGMMLEALGLPAASQAGMSEAERQRTIDVLRSMLPMSLRSPGNNTDIREQNLPQVERLPIAQIAAPTLVIHATNDTLVPFAQGQYSADHIPNARLVTYPDGGHFIVVRDLVWDAVRAFLT